MKHCSLSTEHLQSWALLNGVKLRGVEIQSHILLQDGTDKGGGLVATQDHKPSDVLLIIPHDLVLNKINIEQAVRTDARLQQVLQAVGPEFSQTSRTAILICLILQLTYASQDTKDTKMAISTPLTDYVKFLPKNIPLPIVYSAEEKELLSGTSLDAALGQKLNRLRQEFDHLESSTKSIQWCQELWWSEDSGILNFDDWKAADAMYRSRALELPHGTGDSMVPVLDMANHASGGKHNARFDLDDAGNVQLVTRDDATIHTGDEITIMYGCGGACEMIFSYGFLEKDAQSAREMFLDLRIPDDDPLKRAKLQFASEAPGVRIYTDIRGLINWESTFVWWACINEEDGLDFQILQQNDGSMELKATWKGTNFEKNELGHILKTDPLWEIFQLRAVVTIQGRIEMQGMELSLSQEAFDAAAKRGDGGPTVDTIGRLRDLEMELLAATYQSLEMEKIRLSASDTVREYLTKQEDPDRIGGTVDEDFS